MPISPESRTYVSLRTRSVAAAGCEGDVQLALVLVTVILYKISSMR